MADDIRARLEAAFPDRLQIPSNKESELKTAIDSTLAILVSGLLRNPPPDITPNKFKLIGKETSRKELDQIAKKADELASHLEDLHQPAILALADRGVLHHLVARLIRSLVSHARLADVSKLPEKDGRGRPPKPAATIVAGAVIHLFEKISGGSANLPADATRVFAGAR